jgi:hypothetical protein
VVATEEIVEGLGETRVVDRRSLEQIERRRSMIQRPMGVVCASETPASTPGLKPGRAGPAGTIDDAEFWWPGMDWQTLGV